MSKVKVEFCVGKSPRRYDQEIILSEKWDMGVIRRLLCKPENTYGEVRVISVRKVGGDATSTMIRKRKR